MGRSYGDASLGGTLLGTLRLDRLRAFNEKSDAPRWDADVNLAEIVDVFLPHGWLLAQRWRIRTEHDGESGFSGPAPRPQSGHVAAESTAPARHSVSARHASSVSRADAVLGVDLLFAGHFQRHAPEPVRRPIVLRPFRLVRGAGPVPSNLERIETASGGTGREQAHPTAHIERAAGDVLLQIRLPRRQPL